MHSNAAPCPTHRHWLARTLTVTLASSFALAAQAFDNNGLWDIPLEELGKIRVVSIASGTSTPLDKAAAVTSVITADDIAAMGANDLDQVLQTVPGLHVNYSDQAFFPKYIFRGVTSTTNPQALLLINGVPVTSTAIGNRMNVWGGMPVKSIARIEVIRGPGSALYGADAYAGVINIITKSYRDIPATVAGVRAGSFNTRGAWLETGTRDGDVDLGLTLEYQATKGWRETIDQDAQSIPDLEDGTNASLAPGPVNTSVTQVDMRFEAGNDNWRLRAGVQERSNIGTGVGIAQALDPEGRYGSRRFNTDYSYRWRELIPQLDLEARVSYLYMTQEPKKDIVLFPPGAFGGVFPDGFIGSPGYAEQQARADISSLYRGFDNHLVRTGIGGLWGDLYKVTERKNFNPDGSPKGGVEDVSNRPDEVWMREKDRTSLYAFVQDEWQFAQNWQLVTGLRYDYYSDFGETINPRAALIWATTDDITTKLLYGRAFRAPSLLELYVVNNPINIGNEQLKPETIHTVELAMTHQLDRNLLYSVNLFYYEISNFITAVAVPGQASEYRNVGERTGFGGELEVAYSPSNSLSLVANYAYQRAEDDNTNKAVGEAPNHQLYGRAEWQFMPGWHLNTQVNWVGKQKRIAEDDRKPVSDYTTVDLTLRKLALWRSLDASVTVRNVFDEDVRSPSPYGAPAPAIPNDFPMPGRSLVGELQYTF